jgi:hypothetical protein
MAKNKKISKLYFLILLFFILIIPVSVALAQTSSLNIPNLNIKLPDIGPQDISTPIQNVIKILLIASSVVATIFLIFAGYKYLTSSGNADEAAKAKTQILAVIIGLIIISTSWAIVSLVDKALEGKLRSVSLNLAQPSTTSSTSGGGGGAGTTTPTSPNTSGGQSTESTKPKNNVQEPKPIPSRPADCEYSEQQFSDCFNKDSGMFACYKNANSFLASADNPCNTANLTQAAREACVALKEIRDELYQNFSPDATVTVCDTQVSPTFEWCLRGNPPNPNSCNQKVSSYISKIRGGIIKEKTTPPPAQREERQLTPYQECIKNAREQYTACKAQERELCAAPRAAYESCLRSGLGLIFKSLCNRAKSLYYDCYNTIMRQCQRAYTMQLEYCRIHYRPYY